jgi:TonB family protein
VQKRATRPLSSLAGGILLCLPVAATDLAAAPNDAPALAAWRAQMVERINRSKAFPAGGYCKEGVVWIFFLVDRTGKLLLSKVAKSSNIPVFDVEALAILKRAQPFPPPPESVGGTSVSVRVPMRFSDQPPLRDGEKRLYLNLKSDSTMTFNGVAVQSNGLDRAIMARKSNDKNAWIVICSDRSVPPERVRDIAGRMKAAGFKFIIPRRD